MRKSIIFSILIVLYSCGTYQLAPKDECCETEVVYLEDVKSGTTIFSTLDFKTITLDFKPGFYRSSDLYWFHNYSYMGSRPLWMDFDFYYGNHYSYYNPYYSYFNRPWNYWDWYMRPWMPFNNWNQGPFNNQGYNVVYNSSRRGRSNINSNRSNRMSIEDKIAFGKIGNSRLITNKPVVNTKPVVVTKPIVNNKPTWNNNSNSNNIIVKPNNNKPVIRNNNSRPSFNNNSRPSNNLRPSISVKSRGGKNN